MNVGSLFAGIGGFDLGLERAGMTIEWQVENDPFCNRVLSKHWPRVPRFGDIRECGAQNLATVDLICGGFPCQPYSIAGKRQGQADDRDLWPEMFRVISELRPAWVLCENVTEIDGVALDDCLSDLEAAGYETAPPLEIPACAVNAPHIRQRVWVVAYDAGNIRRTSRHDRSEPSNGSGADVANPGCGDARERSNSNEVHSGGNGTEKTADTISGSGDAPDPDQQHGDISGFHSGTIPQQQKAGIRPDISDTISERFKRRREKSPWPNESASSNQESNWWDSEPDVGRVAHGVPARVDRLKSLGNAVVPQLVEIIGRAIMQTEAEG